MKNINTTGGMEAVENPTTSDNTMTAAENPTTAEITQSIGNIEISNVFKSVSADTQSRDKHSIDIVLVRFDVGHGSKATVFYEDRKTSEIVDGLGLSKGDRLPDSGLVVSVSKGTVRRKYATVRISLDDLADKIAALDESAWQPRTKTRQQKES